MTRDAAARVKRFKRRTEVQRRRVVLHVLDTDTGTWAEVPGWLRAAQRQIKREA